MLSVHAVRPTKPIFGRKAVLDVFAVRKSVSARELFGWAASSQPSAWAWRSGILAR
jgi:hypothetical protein